MKARTLHDVIRIIDLITEKAIVEQDRTGYFAALYRHVAVKFAWAIADGEFADPELMEGLDVVFFNRYLAALEAFQAHESCSGCWEVAFRAAKTVEPIVLQHLVIGMNAHIDFDLGIAVADSVPRARLASFKPDFDKMNALLSSLLNGVLDDLTTVWPLLRLINRLFADEETIFVNFGMDAARAAAWSNANRLSDLADRPEARAIEIRAIDWVVTGLGEELWRPPFPVSTVIPLVRAGERGDVASIIRDLLANSGQPPPRSALLARFAEKKPVPRPSPASGVAPESGATAKRRVIVLGAGQAAMTAAFQLTHPQNPAAPGLDVSVYQLGWRLGGKGATGRNPDFAYRIEEHGLHNWFGFYDNSFRQIRDCYEELGRAPDAPLATWQQAFHPADEAIFTENIGGQHLFWKIENPPNDEVPGSGGLFLPLWEYVLMAIEALFEQFDPRAPGGPETEPETQRALDGAAELDVDTEHGKTPGHDLLGTAIELGKLGKDDGDTSQEKSDRIKSVLARVFGWGEARIDALDGDTILAFRWLTIEILRTFMTWLWSRIGPNVLTDTEGRRLWILANFGFACIVGCLEKDVYSKGFDVLDDDDVRPFLARYAIDDGGIMLGSPLVRALYDSSFAYLDGDTTIPPGQSYPPKESFAMGTALLGMVRSAFTYKGAFGYRFAAGTADTTYAPMYLVMKKRGVAFHFFHRVIEVVHDGADPAKPIAKVRIARQIEITPEQEAKGGYDPLFDVKGLPCWPSTPFWNQIEGGERLRQRGVNLECPPEGFVDAGEIVLERGKDFDDIVLGISIAALPYVCPGVIASSQKWKDATNRIKTVRTQGLQLWLSKPSSVMGFPFLGAPIASWHYDDASSLNVWGDLTELLPFEGWPVNPYPLNLAYYTSPMADDPLPPAATPPPVPGVAVLPPCFDCEAQAQKVRANAIRLLDQGAFIPWPNASHMDGEKRVFDWDLLVDLRAQHYEGEARIDSQFYKANVALTERYVLSVPGSGKYRLQVHDDREFPNLYLAGDWTWCGLNVGAMESATMSGMLCSLALSGFPARPDITGVDFGHGPPMVPIPGRGNGTSG